MIHVHEILLTLFIVEGGKNGVPLNLVFEILLYVGF